MSEKYYCPDCDTEMEEVDSCILYHCPYCDKDFEYTEDNRGNVVFFELDEDDDDDDNMPAGCVACGCPAYPKCKTSCKLFDD